MQTASRSNNTLIDVPRGLTNVVVADTALGEVRGHEGFYNYREYSAVELAEKKSVEEVWHLLLRGSLPTAEQLSKFQPEAPPALHPSTQQALPIIARAAQAGDALAGLRTALALEGAATATRPLFDLNAEDREKDLIQLALKVPVIIAALHRHNTAQDPVTPVPGAGYVENYLRMITGTTPPQEHVAAVSTYLVAAIDHGFNASTFTARVIASTGADAASCLVGALGSLSEPLHGGAPSRVLDTLDSIGTENNIDAWITEKVQSGQRIMGFGHPVYRTEDPRSRLLKKVALGFGGPRVDFAVKVEERVPVLLELLKPGRALHTNLEFYAGVVMEQCGLNRSLFTPTFAAARVLGWTANILEQAADGKIIRPSARYVGPTAPQPVP
ncbi:citrate/2-methylcitrate synthase [Arthrobacter sp. H5]|uniref:citrate/2-methylcitrate synthase n=1 Tax=Arthrobacter sp. H5 TaxID=1267973 RepID=UPI0004B7D41B|nr:citrate/2-methylcitrate synthase [Arthrobacter sp. H5]